MNPTPQRIQKLFADNDLDNYYWANFEKFLQGHSYKAIVTLLNSLVWTPSQQRTLLAIADGLPTKIWYDATPDQQNWLWLTKAQIRTNFSYTGILNPLASLRFKTLLSSWHETTSFMKFNVWNSWGSGIKYADTAGIDFMHECMKRWIPLTPDETKWKIQALVGTLDVLGEGDRSKKSNDHHWIGVYSQILEAEVKSMKDCWDTSRSSVHTWRQLQGYPDFLLNLGHPHPWMETLCVVYTGLLVPNLPDAMVFRELSGSLTGQHVKRGLTVNPSNPHDHLLASALWSYFSNEPVHPDPQIAGIYYLLEGSTDMMGALLGFTPAESPLLIEVDSDVFDYHL